MVAADAGASRPVVAASDFDLIVDDEHAMFTLSESDTVEGDEGRADQRRYRFAGWLRDLPAVQSRIALRAIIGDVGEVRAGCWARVLVELHGGTVLPARQDARALIIWLWSCCYPVDVGYRDDVDTLYQHALILQKELDQAQEKLADRDQELERLLGTRNRRHDTSPGMRQLRQLPPAHTLLSRLVSTISRTPPPLPGVRPMRSETVFIDEEHEHAVILEQSREELGRLDNETLVLVGALIEELALAPETRNMLLSELRPIVDAIAKAHATRKRNRQ